MRFILTMALILISWAACQVAGAPEEGAAVQKVSEEGIPHEAESEDPHDHGHQENSAGEIQQEEHESHEEHNHELTDNHEETGVDSGDGHEGEEENAIELSAAARSNLGVTTATVERGDVAVTRSFYGWVRPRPQDLMNVHSPISGLIRSIHVWPGEFVEEGSPLITLAVPEWLTLQEAILRSVNEKNQLEASRGLLLDMGYSEAVRLLGEIQVAHKDVEKIQEELNLLDQANGKGAVSVREINLKRGELNAAVTTCRSKQVLALTYGIDPVLLEEYERGKEIPARFDAALPPSIRKELGAIDYDILDAETRARVAGGKLRAVGASPDWIEELRKGNREALMDFLTIRSPHAGLVMNVDVSVHSAVNAEDRLMRVIDYRKVFVDVEIPEVDIGKVMNRASDVIAIQIPALDGGQFLGKVVYLDTEVAPDERMAHLVVEVDNDETLTLRSGMAATVEVPLQIRRGVLCVPAESALPDGVETVVFVATLGGFLRTPIEVGAKTLDKIEVKSGLSSGQEVAVRGAVPLLLAFQERGRPAPAGGHGHQH